jgi:hypothetical protein
MKKQANPGRGQYEDTEIFCRPDDNLYDCLICWICVRLGYSLAIQARCPPEQLWLSTKDIEMQKKCDYNSMNKFKGPTDRSNGYTVMQNLNGSTMRGYIDKDGSGLLQDQNGNFYRVNTRW